MTFGEMDYEEPDLGLKLTRWDNKTLQSRKIFIFDIEGYALRCAQSQWHPERDAYLKSHSIARVLKTSGNTRRRTPRRRYFTTSSQRSGTNWTSWR